MTEMDADDDKVALEPDYTPIDPGVLKTYPLSPGVGDYGDPPITAIGDQDVSAVSPLEGMMIPERDYVVDVEYSSTDSALHKPSLKRYFGTFKEAKISQETVAQLVHKHLSTALSSKDVFVEVKSVSVGKRIRIGSVL